jgi:RNA polymerase sigma-70 factor, ECF subfamily
MGHESDLELVEKVRGGDTTAYGELVNRHAGVVTGVVSRMVDDRDDVDDIVSQVFVKAYRSLASFRGRSAYSTWLYRIAVNTAISYRSARAKRQHVSVDDPISGVADRLEAPDGDDPQNAAERSQMRAVVRAAVSTLPEKHRTVVVLYYFQGMPCQQIAEILGCSVGTIWSRLHHACKKLGPTLKGLEEG